MAKAKTSKKSVKEAEVRKEEQPAVEVKPEVLDVLFTPAYFKKQLSTLHRMTARINYKHREPPFQDDIDELLFTLSRLAEDHVWTPWVDEDNELHRSVKFSFEKGASKVSSTLRSITRLLDKEDADPLPHHIRMTLSDAAIELKLAWGAIIGMIRLHNENRAWKTRIKYLEAKLAAIEGKPIKPGSEDGRVVNEGERPSPLEEV